MHHESVSDSTDGSLPVSQRHFHPVQDGEGHAIEGLEGLLIADSGTDVDPRSLPPLPLDGEGRITIDMLKR